MKVCVIGKGRAVMEDLPVPKMGNGDVLVSMKACGICGTDLEKISGNYASRTLGHEAVGVVSDTGKDVENVAVGERVFPHHHVPCYECHYCRNGSETMCPHFSKANIHPGGLAEFFLLPEWNIVHGGLFRLPAGLSFRLGTLIEPLACVIRGLEKLGLNSESTVAVIGAGPVGMLQIYALKEMGVRKIVAMDVSEERHQFATRLGALAAGEPGEAMLSAVKELSDGRGADSAVIATGHPSATEYGIASLRNGGRLLQFGLPHPGTALIHDVSDMFRREIQFITSYSGVEKDVAKAIKMLTSSGEKADVIISHSFRLERAPEAFVLAEKAAESRKIIVEN